MIKNHAKRRFSSRHTSVADPSQGARIIREVNPTGNIIRAYGKVPKAGAVRA